MKSFRNIKKDAKALSPVVASIILIAVTVAVSVVVAAWMGGMSIGLMGNAEQATITNIAFDNTGANTILNVSYPEHRSWSHNFHCILCKRSTTDTDC